MLEKVCISPYVAYAVSEISAIKNLDNWNNTKVKVLGCIDFDLSSSNSKASLQSVGEDGTFSVKVCIFFWLVVLKELIKF